MRGQQGPGVNSDGARGKSPSPHTTVVVLGQSTRGKKYLEKIT